jgi:hypothetical protein
VSGVRGSVRRRVVIDIALGILILSLPKLSLATLAVLVAVSLLARGAFAIYVPARADPPALGCAGVSPVSAGVRGAAFVATTSQVAMPP